MITTVRRAQLVSKAQAEVDRISTLLERHAARRAVLAEQLRMANVELEYRKGAPVSDEEQ